MSATIPSADHSTHPWDDAASISNESLASSIFSGLMHPGRTFDHMVHPNALNAANGVQADAARLTNTLRSLVEVNDRCWRGEDCELCAGVRVGVSTVA